MPALALFFLTAADSSALAASYDYDNALTGYITRMILALMLLGAAGYAAVKYLPGKFGITGRGHLKLIGSMSLGRDMVYIVRTGPHVVAFYSGKTGSSVLGKWSLDEWNDYEAVSSFVEKVSPEEKKPQ
ncbi:MAG: hypothetical protein LBT23_00505 [Synergistaceae bacterium]|nr:hypothetical protein [Synergistaceae bacterium]